MTFARTSNLIGTTNEPFCVHFREAPMLACEHGEWVRLSTLALQAEPNRCNVCSVHPHHVTPKIDVATGSPYCSCPTLHTPARLCQASLTSLLQIIASLASSL